MVDWVDPNAANAAFNSDKKDNPDYIMNPVTGRYVLRDGPTGRQILFGNTSRDRRKPRFEINRVNRNGISIRDADEMAHQEKERIIEKDRLRKEKERLHKEKELAKIVKDTEKEKEKEKEKDLLARKDHEIKDQGIKDRELRDREYINRNDKDRDKERKERRERREIERKERALEEQRNNDIKQFRQLDETSKKPRIQTILTLFEDDLSSVKKEQEHKKKRSLIQMGKEISQEIVQAQQKNIRPRIVHVTKTRILPPGSITGPTPLLVPGGGKEEPEKTVKVGKPPPRGCARSFRRRTTSTGTSPRVSPKVSPRKTLINAKKKAMVLETAVLDPSQQSPSIVKKKRAGIKGPRPKKTIYVYTDGAVSNNKRNSHLSLGGVGVYFAPRDKRNLSEKFDQSPTTNQRAELWAIIRALQIINQDPLNKTFLVAIFTDSMYALNVLTKIWKAKDNLDLVEQGWQLLEEVPHVVIRHIRAHTGKKDPHSIGNKMADQLATTARDLAKV